MFMLNFALSNVHLMCAKLDVANIGVTNTSRSTSIECVVTNTIKIQVKIQHKCRYKYKCKY